MRVMTLMIMAMPLGQGQERQLEDSNNTIMTRAAILQRIKGNNAIVTRATTPVQQWQ
jgi:hypothetical protein